MRLKACKEAGLKQVPIIMASELTEEQQRRFIIADNVGYGEWDWNMLANEWDAVELGEWGLDVWQQPSDVDYSILDGADDSLDSQLDELSNGVKKAIQIEFEIEHFEEASEIVRFFRERGLYIGGFLMEKLKEEREKLAL